MTFTTSISTVYKQVDGWHVFMSDQLPGLYVASRDLETAWRDVGPSIQTLLMLDMGVQCTVMAETTLEDFIAQARGERAEGEADYVSQHRRFAVCGTHA